MFINPLISLLSPSYFLVYGPFGNLIGEGLGATINFLSDRSGLKAGAVGVFIRTKDNALKSLAASGILPGSLDRTTEAIYYRILLRFSYKASRLML
ncbi:hypothetical protein [Oceanobacillus alkalisoli]|uniref:hypothetical protein n=1 Tax=Oceanobacillus alkalisoli TaxID=2925113 RepID=UPI001F11D708|nr:hypothetical protein [Oceanobacillus alkalisoli]MCF3943965.1 hypothetical protein [Oceanobacillus alkalisoli]